MNNQSSSQAEFEQLCRAVENQFEEHQELTNALQKLVEAIEAKKADATQETAFGLMKDIARGAYANVLGGGVLEIIKKLAGI